MGFADAITQAQVLAVKKRELAAHLRVHGIPGERDFKTNRKKEHEKP